MKKEDLMSDEEAVQLIMQRTGKNFEQASLALEHSIGSGRLKPFDKNGNEITLDALFGPPPNVEWVPHIRMRFVGDDGKNYGDLRAVLEWWDMLPKAEANAMISHGRLNKRECARFWKYLGRNDKPPKGLRIALNKDDLRKRMPHVKWD